MKERIEKILNDKKLTQAEFADFIGVNRSSITHIMTERNKTSDTVVARTLLSFPDINPQWLSEGIGEMYKPFLDTHTGEYIPENKQYSIKTPVQIPFPELNIRSVSDDAPVISTPQQDENRKENIVSFPIVEKQIRKIVFFYADKTFEEYYPENTTH
jgi:DNA-binding XRE family transcriptional regulator